MKVYTYSQARQKLADLLNDADRNEEVRIRRRDGQVYTVKSLSDNGSPLDVKSVKSSVSFEYIKKAIRESRDS